MWPTSQPSAPQWGGSASQPHNQSQQSQKHDIFVGNLAFSTTEEQLHQAFSELGRIVKVRMVTDLETGKPRGFAFIEFENAQDALSAIRNMNEYELNGRKIRVNFSNSSHLETLAGQLGMDMTQKTKNISGFNNANPADSASSATTSSGAALSTDTQAVSNAIKSMSKGEMYDVVAKLKEIADSDPDEARKIISGHPQLPEAILFLMSQLDMVKTPVNTNVLGVGINTSLPPPPPQPMDISAAATAPSTTAPSASIPRIDPRRAADPRAGATPSIPNHAPPPPLPIDPRAMHAASDPRRAADPRRQQQQPPSSGGAPPPPPPQPMFMPPPPQPPAQQPPAPGAHGMGGAAELDPSLVQQVMGLTPAQIAQLPVDKQSSILALRQHLQNQQSGMGH